MIKREVREIIGEKLRILRERMNLTQQELAERLGYTQAFISSVENGKRTPSIKFLEKVAIFFDIPLAWLLEETPRNVLSLLFELSVFWKRLETSYPQHRELFRLFLQMTLSQMETLKKILPPSEGGGPD